MHSPSYTYPLSHILSLTSTLIFSHTLTITRLPSHTPSHPISDTSSSPLSLPPLPSAGYNLPTPASSRTGTASRPGSKGQGKRPGDPPFGTPVICPLQSPCLTTRNIYPRPPHLSPYTHTLTYLFTHHTARTQGLDLLPCAY